MNRRWFLASVSLFAGGAGCLGDVTDRRNTPGARDDRTGSPVCPPFETSANRSVCYPPRSPDGPVHLSVDYPTWRVNPSDKSVQSNTFTLHNDSETDLRFPVGSWTLHEQTDFGWRVVSQNRDTSVVTAESGGTYRWVLRRAPPSSTVAQTEHITVDIDAGRYAFVVRVPSPDGTSSLDCFAMFTLTLA